MTKLTDYEKETVINYNEEEKEASVYTYNKKLKQKLARLAKKYPQQVRLDRDYGYGAVSYLVPRNCIIVREPYSEEHRMAARERELKRRSNLKIAGAAPDSRPKSMTGDNLSIKSKRCSENGG